MNNKMMNNLMTKNSKAMMMKNLMTILMKMKKENKMMMKNKMNNKHPPQNKHQNLKSIKTSLNKNLKETKTKIKETDHKETISNKVENHISTKEETKVDIKVETKISTMEGINLTTTMAVVIKIGKTKVETMAATKIGKIIREANHLIIIKAVNHLIINSISSTDYDLNSFIIFLSIIH